MIKELQKLKTGDVIWEYFNTEIHYGKVEYLRLHPIPSLYARQMNVIGDLDWHNWSIPSEVWEKMNARILVEDSGRITSTSFKMLLNYLIEKRKAVWQIGNTEFCKGNERKIIDYIFKCTH